MLVPYPKLLSDPVWKKLEKKAGVSSTGVGKTLRDAAKVWDKLNKEVGEQEMGDDNSVATNAARKELILALEKPYKLLRAMADDPKLKNVDKKKVLNEYAAVLNTVVEAVSLARFKVMSPTT